MREGDSVRGGAKEVGVNERRHSIFCRQSGGRPKHGGHSAVAGTIQEVFRTNLAIAVGKQGKNFFRRNELLFRLFSLYQVGG
jgi:hypothetical protein